MTGTKVTTFEERFAELLRERPESSTELANKMNVSKQTISAWKLGDRHPNKITTVAIANFFNVNIDWLYGFDVEKKRKSGSNYSEHVSEEKNSEQAKRETRLLRAFREAEPKYQDLALELLEEHPEKDISMERKAT